MATASDSALSSGFCGMRFLTQGGSATISSFLAIIPGGSGTPTPTVTPSPTVTITPSPTMTVTPTMTVSPSPTVIVSPTPTVTVSPSPTVIVSPSPTVTVSPSPSPGTTIAQDSFQRANHSLWGTASDGQTWGGDANSVGAFSISGNAGLVSNTGWASYSAVLGPAATNAEVYVTGSLSSFNGTNFGDVLRWTDGNNWYKAYIDGANLIIQRRVGGLTRVIASVPFVATAGTAYTIHFRVVGTTLSANVWLASGSEPSGWMATASDSALSSGFCGMRFLTQGGSATISSFLARLL